MSGGLAASMISGVNFFCLGLTNSVLRWRFLGDLRFGYFSDDLFLMKVITDGITLVSMFLCDVQHQHLYIINIRMKFSYICVICNFKRICPTSSSECFDFITPQFIQFWLWIFIWKFKQSYVRFLPIFVILCTFTRWNATVLPFSTYIKLFWLF